MPRTNTSPPIRASRPSELPVAVVFDGGNAIAKMVLVRPGKLDNYVVYPHAIKQITDTQFHNLKARADMRAGLIGDGFIYTRKFKVDGQQQVASAPYVIGGSAANYGVLERRTGSAKYETFYYGPYMTRGFLSMFPEGHQNITVLTMFPPGDVAYVSALRDSVLGIHKATLPNGNEITYHVRNVLSVDEPVGGLMRRILGHDGTMYTDGSTGISGDNLLVLDIGGQVTSMTPANADGMVSYESSVSIPIGINDVEVEFEAEIRRNHEEFRLVRVFSPALLRKALESGLWVGGGGEPIDLKSERDNACATLLMRIRDALVTKLGGPLTYTQIIVTGGGGKLLFDMLRTPEVLNHMDVILSDKNDTHLANARGGAMMLIFKLSQDKTWAAAWASK